MGTEKRARQKANREAKKVQEQAEAKAEAREESTKKIGKWVAVAAAIIVLILLWSFLRGGDDESAEGRTFANTAEAEEIATEPEVVELATSVPDDFEPWAGVRALANVVPEARADAYDSPPPFTIDTDLTYTALISTDAGPIRLELFADEAPLTVNNFVNLANDGFYDGVSFHRVLSDFMAQGGDPTGSGIGGPGYMFDDEISATRGFDRPGILAMANAGPATNGSQFFITFEPTPWLNELHTIFGSIPEGGDLTVLDDIIIREPGGVDATVIESIRISAG